MRKNDAVKRVYRRARQAHEARVLLETHGYRLEKIQRDPGTWWWAGPGIYARHCFGGAYGPIYALSAGDAYVTAAILLKHKLSH